jgi:hypothetical protein
VSDANDEVLEIGNNVTLFDHPCIPSTRHMSTGKEIARGVSSEELRKLYWRRRKKLKRDKRRWCGGDFWPSYLWRLFDASPLLGQRADIELNQIGY